MTKTCYTCRKPAVWRLFIPNPKAYALTCDDHLRKYAHENRWVTIALVPANAEPLPVEEVAA